MSLINGNGNGGEKLVNSAILTVVARFAMITAAAALPVGGWMLQRSISTVDEIARKIDSVKDLSVETSLNVKLIQQMQQFQASAVSDHEARVRAIEARKVRP